MRKITQKKYIRYPRREVAGIFYCEGGNFYKNMNCTEGKIILFMPPVKQKGVNAR